MDQGLRAARTLTDCSTVSNAGRLGSISPLEAVQVDFEHVIELTDIRSNCRFFNIFFLNTKVLVCALPPLCKLTLFLIQIFKKSDSHNLKRMDAL